MSATRDKKRLVRCGKEVWSRLELKNLYLRGHLHSDRIGMSQRDVCPQEIMARRSKEAIWFAVATDWEERAKEMKKEYFRRRDVILPALKEEGVDGAPYHPPSFYSSIKHEIRRAGSVEAWLKAPLEDAKDFLRSAKDAISRSKGRRAVPKYKRDNITAETETYSRGLEVAAAIRFEKIQCTNPSVSGVIHIYPRDDDQVDIARKICGDMGVRVHIQEMGFRDAMRQERQSFGPGLSEEEPGAPSLSP